MRLRGRDAYLSCFRLIVFHMTIIYKMQTCDRRAIWKHTERFPAIINLHRVKILLTPTRISGSEMVWVRHHCYTETTRRDGYIQMNTWENHITCKYNESIVVNEGKFTISFKWNTRTQIDITHTSTTSDGNWVSIVSYDSWFEDLKVEYCI